MKVYFIAKGNQHTGPFSLEELTLQSLDAETLVWKKGWSDWVKAQEVSELRSLLEIPPPLSSLDTSNDKNTVPSSYSSYAATYNDDGLMVDDASYDYSQVEDIAGVDYKKAMYITAAYIVLNIFYKQEAVLGFFGIIISTTLAVFVWWYFKKYFDEMKDKSTAAWIQWIMGAHILFGVANLFSVSHLSVFGILDSAVTDNSQLVQGFGFMVTGVLVALTIVFISGFKLIAVNHRHPFPLKRIAISTMIFIPAYMLLSLFENMPLVNQTMAFLGWESRGVSITRNAVVMLPFFFLLQHFYRADKYDATP